MNNHIHHKPRSRSLFSIYIVYRPFIHAVEIIAITELFVVGTNFISKWFDAIKNTLWSDNREKYGLNVGKNAKDSFANKFQDIIWLANRMSYVLQIYANIISYVLQMYENHVFYQKSLSLHSFVTNCKMCIFLNIIQYCISIFCYSFH